LRLRFLEDSAAEFLEATRHYDAQEEGLGAAFVADIEKTSALALAFPRIGTPGPLETRRLLLSRFPYALVYRAETEVIVIIAVEHQHREPGYWKARSS